MFKSMIGFLLYFSIEYLLSVVIKRLFVHLINLHVIISVTFLRCIKLFSTVSQPSFKNLMSLNNSEISRCSLWIEWLLIEFSKIFFFTFFFCFWCWASGENIWFLNNSCAWGSNFIFWSFRFLICTVKFWERVFDFSTTGCVLLIWIWTFFNSPSVCLAFIKSKVFQHKTHWSYY